MSNFPRTLDEVADSRIKQTIISTFEAPLPKGTDTQSFDKYILARDLYDKQPAGKNS